MDGKQQLIHHDVGVRTSVFYPTLKNYVENERSKVNIIPLFA